MIHFSQLAVAILATCVRDKQLPPTSKPPHFKVFAHLSPNT